MKRGFFITITICVALSIPMSSYCEDIVNIKKKPYVDGDDVFDFFFDEEEYLSFGYSYSSILPANTMFPMALHIHSTLLSYFLLSAEVGVNFDKTNFLVNGINYNPHFYLLAGPGVNFRYFAIDCGFGAIYGRYIYETDKISFTESKMYFLCQPALYGYIPIDGGMESVFLTLKVGYNIAPSFSAANGLTLGAGIRLQL